MQLLTRFVTGLGVGATLVALVLWTMPPAVETAANPPLPPVPNVPGPPVSPPSTSRPVMRPAGDLIPLPLTPSAGAISSLPLPEPATPADFVKPVETKEPSKLPPGRTAIRLSGPAGMKVSWLIGASFHDRDLTAPAAYNFVQGQVYRLRLADMTKYPQTKFYPTLEVTAPGEKATTFLAHNALPLTFTEAELASAAEGRLVVKAVYLPTVADGPLAASEEVSSLRLVGNADAVSAASGRGTLLAVVRLGNVDLENPNSPPLNAPTATDSAIPVKNPLLTPSAPFRIPDSAPGESP